MFLWYFYCHSSNTVTYCLEVGVAVVAVVSSDTGDYLLLGYFIVKVEAREQTKIVFETCLKLVIIVQIKQNVHTQAWSALRFLLFSTFETAIFLRP